MTGVRRAACRSVLSLGFLAFLGACGGLATHVEIKPEYKRFSESEMQRLYVAEAPPLSRVAGANSRGQPFVGWARPDGIAATVFTAGPNWTGAAIIRQSNVFAWWIDGDQWCLQGAGQQEATCRTHYQTGPGQFLSVKRNGHLSSKWRSVSDTFGAIRDCKRVYHKAGPGSDPAPSDPSVDVCPGDKLFFARQTNVCRTWRASGESRTPTSCRTYFVETQDPKDLLANLKFEGDEYGWSNSGHVLVNVNSDADFFLSVLPTRSRDAVAFLLAVPKRRPIASVILLPGGRGHLNLYRNWNTELYPRGLPQRILGRLAKEGIMAALVDAPMRSNRPRESDPNNGMSIAFRTSEDHAADVSAVAAALQRRSQAPVWLFGHSNGTASAASIALRRPRDFDGLILASSVTQEGKTTFDIATLSLSEVAKPVLMLVNPNDACWGSPPREQRDVARSFGQTAVVRVAEIEGETTDATNPCWCPSAHCFSGAEDDVVSAIVEFIGANGRDVEG